MDKKGLSYADDTRYEYWKRMEFTAQAWAGLRQHAEDRGLAFLSSPFSLEAVDLLRRALHPDEPLHDEDIEPADPAQGSR